MKQIINGLAAGVIAAIGCGVLVVPAIVSMIIVALAILSAEVLVA